MLKENACNFSPCINGGTCTSLNDEDQLYSCTCPSGCSGRNCSVCTTACSTINCLNGGRCLVNAASNLPYCVCASGYIGSLCGTC